LHIVLTLLLILSLLAAVIAFTAMGYMQRRRRGRLSVAAHDMGMRFSAEDPFDTPARYADFALICSGHSQCAANFIHGPVDRYAVRSFDFRYEVGHGPRRCARQYSVIAVVFDKMLPELIMWSKSDVEAMPLAMTLPHGEVSGWNYRGEREMARLLAEAFADEADEGLGIEIRGQTAMFFMPARVNRTQFAQSMPNLALRAKSAIEDSLPTSDAGEKESG